MYLHRFLNNFLLPVFRTLQKNKYIRHNDRIFVPNSTSHKYITKKNNYEVGSDIKTASMLKSFYVGYSELLNDIINTEIGHGNVKDLIIFRLF